MDIRDLSRHDLAVIASAIVERDIFISALVAATIAGYEVRVAVERCGRRYVVVVLVVEGEAVVAEHRLVVRDDADEVARLVLLKLYVAAILAGLDRWRRRQLRLDHARG